MALEHLHELVEEVQDLQEATKGSVEPDKVRALARLVLELAQAVQDVFTTVYKSLRRRRHSQCADLTRE